MSKEDVSSSSINLEWRINVPGGGAPQILATKSAPATKLWSWIKHIVIGGLILPFGGFFKNAWRLGAEEPRKVVHGLKVGLALSLVSLFYYVRPLYDGVGGNASMWAVMTVVVVFESTVGATLSKCVNRAAATFVAGALALGIHLLAERAGEKAEPIILAIAVFLFASAATFSRFMPSVKTRFDYGAMIFILTFSLVSVSGYRVEKLFEMARQRLSTIAIGASLCIIISMVVCPIWAGDELHRLINRNMEKLTNSLEGCINDNFKENGKTQDEEENSKKMEGYKCVLNSKATEELLANFARWEPAHGRFNFGHPWKQYLKIGASMRSCAYCIETLSSYLSSEIHPSPSIKTNLREEAMKFGSCTTKVLKELSNMTKTMTHSSTLDLSIVEMNFAAKELQTALNLNINDKGESGSPSLLDILPLVTAVSLLTENVERIGGVADAVEELARIADFKPAKDDNKHKNNQNKTLPKVVNSNNVRVY